MHVCGEGTRVCGFFFAAAPRGVAGAVLTASGLMPFAEGDGALRGSRLR